MLHDAGHYSAASGRRVNSSLSAFIMASVLFLARRRRLAPLPSQSRFLSRPDLKEANLSGPAADTRVVEQGADITPIQSCQCDDYSVQHWQQPLRYCQPMRSLLIIGGLAFSVIASAAVAIVPQANGWVIGPIIKGKNYSPGMPLHPSNTKEGLFDIDLPEAPGSAHYVTFRHGSLEGKRRIILRYRLEAAPGVSVTATTSPGGPALITPYFQRAGDNWSGRGRFESYRWYATFGTQTLTPGTHQIVAPLNANWTAVETTSARSNPAAFRDAIANADQVGFVLGGGTGYGHGVHATGRARLIVTDFRVE